MKRIIVQINEKQYEFTVEDDAFIRFTVEPSNQEIKDVKVRGYIRSI